MTRMNASTHRVVEREERHVAVDTRKPDRPRRVGKESAPAAAGDRPSVFEKHFGLFARGVVLIWVFIRTFDFSLLPPAYKGLVITQPFDGLHSWDVADRAWAARSHLQYGLGYDKGLRTLVVGDPPLLIPKYYVSHPPLESWVTAVGMRVFGTQDWSVRLFELVFSVPCLFLILLLLRKLHGSACALLPMAGSACLAGLVLCAGFFLSNDHRGNTGIGSYHGRGRKREVPTACCVHCAACVSKSEGRGLPAFAWRPRPEWLRHAVI